LNNKFNSDRGEGDG
jgi:hypothetical protein